MKICTSKLRNCIARRIATLSVLLVTSVSLANAQTHWVSQESAFFENYEAWVPQAVPSGEDSSALFGQPATYTVGLLSDHAIGELIVSNNTDVNFKVAGGGLNGEGAANKTFSTTTARVNNATMRLGSTGSPESNDVFLHVSETMDVDGALVVGEGARLSANTFNLGNREVPLATATISGRDTDNGRTQLTANSVTVGNGSKAELHILSVGMVSSETGIVGRNQAAVESELNRVEMSHGSTWNVDNLTVGFSAMGQVFPKSGAKINSESVTLGTAVGNEPEDLGHGIGILVGTDADGRPTAMNTNDLVIGERGTGALDVVDGAVLNAGNVAVASTSAGAGTLSLYSKVGTPISVANVTNLAIGGDMNERGGPATMTLGQRSEAHVGTLTVWPESMVSVEGGKLAAEQISMAGGAFDMTSGVLEVGSFEVDNLIQRGGTFAPGPGTARSVVFGDFTQRSNASLALQIAGVTAGETHDRVAVDGNALIDGELQLELANGFLPADDNTFAVLGAELLFGVFDNVLGGERLTTLDGTGSFMVNYGAESIFDPNQVVLSDFMKLSVIFGDFNNDDLLDAADIDLLNAAIGGEQVEFDLNSDGVVNSVDRDFWVQDVKQTVLGDANFDNAVQFDDFLALSNSFGAKGGWADGDFDGNGDVGFPDFLILSNNFGATSAAAGVAASAASVPEPSGLLLTLFGIAGVLGFRRKK